MSDLVIGQIFQVKYRIPIYEDLWDTASNSDPPRVAYTEPGQLVILVQIHNKGAVKVLTSNGQMGWIDGDEIHEL